MIANAPWYVPNITLHEDLNVPLVKEIIKQRSTRYHRKIEGHVNVLIQPLLQPHNEEDQKGIGQLTYEKVNEELFLDKPLLIILNKSKLAYRIYVILIANKEFLKKIRLRYRRYCIAVDANSSGILMSGNCQK
jgi:hypothetical protein